MQGGAGDGIRVSCGVRNVTVDEQWEIRQKDTLTVFPHAVILKDTCRNTEREGEERDLQGFI